MSTKEGEKDAQVPRPQLHDKNRRLSRAPRVVRKSICHPWLRVVFCAREGGALAGSCIISTPGALAERSLLYSKRSIIGGSESDPARDLSQQHFFIYLFFFFSPFSPCLDCVTLCVGALIAEIERLGSGYVC